MANKLTLKRSAVPGKVPTTTDLDLGEIAINTYDGKAYMKKNVSGVESIVLLVGAGSGDVTGPASSANNAIARFDSTSGKVIKNSGATIDDSGNITAPSFVANGTGANVMPVGTTAQRPATPSSGMFRMNSSTGVPEWWDATNSTWRAFGTDVINATGGTVTTQTINGVTYKFHLFTSSGTFSTTTGGSVEYMVVGGGGGGGCYRGGGGGGGAVAIGAATIPPGSYSVSIGSAGAGATVSTNKAGSGGSSSVAFPTTVTALGGGGAGSHDNSTGAAGGSGGGASGFGGGGNVGGAANGPNTFAGGGYYGGAAVTSGGGGGGGSTAVGTDGSGTTAGNGGQGLNLTTIGYPISGHTNVSSGGGGGRGGSSSGDGLGGTGAGNGGIGTTTAGSSATMYGCGGGGGGQNYGVGGSGFQGVVVIRYRLS